MTRDFQLSVMVQGVLARGLLFIVSKTKPHLTDACRYDAQAQCADGVMVSPWVGGRQNWKVPDDTKNMALIEGNAK